MNKILNKNWPYILLALCFVCILAYNIGAVRGGDEMSYRYEGQKSSYFENPKPITCFGDIYRQQKADYCCRGNGRVLIHSVCAFLSWHELYIPQRIANSLMWFFFVYLVLRASGFRKFSLKEYLAGFAFVFWFFWYSEPCCGQNCFTFNYLWTAAATVCIMSLWNRKAKGYLVPIAIVYSLTMENFVLPFIGATFLTAVYRYFVRRDRSISKLKIASWLLMLPGAGFLCLGPASRSRATGICSVFGIATLKGFVHTILIFSPLLLLLLLVFILFRNRRRVREVIERDLQWWTYLICSFGLFLMLVQDVYLRTAANWLLAAIILVIRNRECFNIRFRWKIALIGYSLLWMVVGAVQQAIVGYYSYKMLRGYNDDPQGVTSYYTLPRGPWFYTNNDSVLVDWYLKFYRLDAKKPERPVVLPIAMYDTLYQNATEFFKHEKAIATNLYTCAKVPGVIIQCDNAPLDLTQLSAMKDYFAADQKSVWYNKKYLPGRLSLFFPRYVSALSLPHNGYSITTKDGLCVRLWRP